MRLVTEYQYRDGYGRIVDEPVPGGGKSVIEEHIVLSPGERKMFSYLIAVVGVGLLLAEMGALVSILFQGSLISLTDWAAKAFWFTAIGLIIMPVTAAIMLVLLRETWIRQKDRIEEERKHSQALVRRKDDMVEMRHRARQALVAAAESGIYDSIAKGDMPDLKQIAALEAAAQDKWQ